MSKALLNVLSQSKILLVLQLGFLAEEKLLSVQLLLHFSLELQIKLELQESGGIILNWWVLIQGVVLVKMGQVKWLYKISDFLEIFQMELFWLPLMVYQLKKQLNWLEIMMGLHSFEHQGLMSACSILMMNHLSLENVLDHLIQAKQLNLASKINQLSSHLV